MCHLKWQNRFLAVAENVALWSKDISTKVGCVIVKDKRIISTGYNGIPRGVKEDIERQDRPVKYFYFEHAERNAIYNCAREGISTEGSSLFIVPFSPCSDCARAVIQAGIKEVYVKNSKVEGIEHWNESIEIAGLMFKESGVQLYKV